MDEKKYGLVVKAAVLSIIVIEYTISLVTPALGAMAAGLQGVSPELVKQVQSLPNLTMIIVALCVGQIERFMSKRKMLTIAMIVMFIGGLAPAFGGGIYFILAMRALFGLGRGIVFPFAMSFIVELFEGQERDILMGFRSSVGSISGIVFMQIGGALATMYWRYAFWGYLLMLPFILMILLKLPEPEKRPAPLTIDGTAQRRLTPKTWMMILLNTCFMFCTYSFMTNVAIVITATKIGTPVSASNVLSTFTLTSAFCGIFFGKFIRPFFKKYTVVVGIASIGAGLTYLVYVNTLSQFFVGAILFGIGFSLYNSDMFLSVPATAHKSAAAMSLAMFMAFNGLGQFGSPIVLAFISKMLGFEGPKAGWTIAGPALLAAAVIVFLVKALSKPKNTDAALNT